MKKNILSRNDKKVEVRRKSKNDSLLIVAILRCTNSSYYKVGPKTLISGKNWLLLSQYWGRTVVHKAYVVLPGTVATCCKPNSNWQPPHGIPTEQQLYRGAEMLEECKPVESL